MALTAFLPSSPKRVHPFWSLRTSDEGMGSNSFRVRSFCFARVFVMKINFNHCRLQMTHTCGASVYFLCKLSADNMDTNKHTHDGHNNRVKLTQVAQATPVRPLTSEVFISCLRVVRTGAPGRFLMGILVPRLHRTAGSREVLNN